MRRFSRLPIGSPQPYSWDSDPRIISWFEPGNGFANKFSASPWGNLLQVGGSVPIGGGLDGHPAYQFSKGVSGCLVTQNTGPNVRFYGPIHTITIIKATAGSNVAGDGWFADPVNATPKYSWNSSAGARLFGNGSNFIVPCTTANYNLHELYLHGSLTRFSINGAAYSTLKNTGIDCKFSGLVMGSAVNNGLGASSNHDCVFRLDYEGQMPDQFRFGLWAYLKSLFPSLNLSSMPGAFDIRPTDPNNLLIPGQFDVVPLIAQSNGSCYSQVSTAAINPNILMLANDNTYKPMTTDYDNQTNHADIVSVEPAALGIGGEAGAMCNAIQAFTGRTLVLVPCAIGGSWVVPGTLSPTQNFYWGPEYPRNFQLANSNYGSAVRRVKDALDRGGNFLFTRYRQGEAEAMSSPEIGALWPDSMTALMDRFHRDIGVVRKRVVFARLSASPHGAGNWTNFITNIQPLAVKTGQAMSETPDGPYNSDGLHLQGVGCDQSGINAFNVAVNEGYIQ